MNLTEAPPKTYLRDLGDGLALRACTPADAEAVADFNARRLSDDGPDKPDEALRVWVRDLFTRPHPTMGPGEFLVVEDTATGTIVSSTMLIPQTWTYAGVPFGVGRPELVATEPDYRRRGLVRAQIEVLHQMSAERGHLVQAITGIPNYYRQFGYEMALNLGGGRAAYAPQVPKLGEGESEPYRLRPATPADLGFMRQVHEATTTQRDLIAVARDEAQWRLELDGRSRDGSEVMELRVIETAEGEPAGFLAHAPKVWTGGLGVRLVMVACELAPGHSWLAAGPSLLRYLWQTGEAYAAERGLALQRLSLGLGEQHPLYEAFADALGQARRPYAWYVRVPDLPGFVRHIAPALEARLARSIAAGHSASLKLSFYRGGGLRLVLERGRLTGVEAWQSPGTDDEGDASFPNLTFLQMLFGHRSLDELRHAYADCWANNDVTRGLLMALFPKQGSNLWALT